MTSAKENSIDSEQLKIYCHKCQQKLDITSLEAFKKINCPSCDAELIVPKRFNSYLLEEKCGDGGSAVVYRALDLTLDREVAIKIFSEHTDSPNFSKIFLHEGRVAASLNHRSIVPIYSCGQHEGQCFLVMQYMPNGNLREYMKNNAELKISNVLSWIVEITKALKFAAEKGVIHHDVKPANILLGPVNKAKLTDFGLSNALHDHLSQSLLSELSSYGSPDYVSPEKLDDGFEDEKGDIFSLGVTVYELLTGRKPFKRAHEEEDILEVRKSVPVISPHTIRPEISIKLSKFVMRMLDNDPVMRPEYDKIIAELTIYQKKYNKHEGGMIYKFIAKHL